MKVAVFRRASDDLSGALLIPFFQLRILKGWRHQQFFFFKVNFFVGFELKL